MSKRLQVLLNDEEYLETQIRGVTLSSRSTTDLPMLYLEAGLSCPLPLAWLATVVGSLVPSRRGLLRK